MSALSSKMAKRQLNSWNEPHTLSMEKKVCAQNYVWGWVTLLTRHVYIFGSFFCFPLKSIRMTMLYYYFCMKRQRRHTQNHHFVVSTNVTNHEGWMYKKWCSKRVSPMIWIDKLTETWKYWSAPRFYHHFCFFRTIHSQYENGKGNVKPEKKTTAQQNTHSELWISKRQMPKNGKHINAK